MLKRVRWSYTINTAFSYLLPLSNNGEDSGVNSTWKYSTPSRGRWAFGTITSHDTLVSTLHKRKSNSRINIHTLNFHLVSVIIRITLIQPLKLSKHYVLATADDFSSHNSLGDRIEYEFPLVITQGSRFTAIHRHWFFWLMRLKFQKYNIKDGCLGKLQEDIFVQRYTFCTNVGHF